MSGDSELISPIPIRINEVQYQLVNNKMIEAEIGDQILIDNVEKQIDDDVDITDEIINNINILKI